MREFSSWSDSLGRLRIDSRCKRCKRAIARELHEKEKAREDRAARREVEDWGALEGLRAEAHAVAEEWRARGLEAVLILRAAATEIHEEVSGCEGADDEASEYEDARDG